MPEDLLRDLPATASAGKAGDCWPYLATLVSWIRCKRIVHVREAALRELPERAISFQDRCFVHSHPQLQRLPGSCPAQTTAPRRSRSTSVPDRVKRPLRQMFQ